MEQKINVGTTTKFFLLALVIIAIMVVPAFSFLANTEVVEEEPEALVIKYPWNMELAGDYGVEHQALLKYKGIYTVSIVEEQEYFVSALRYVPREIPQGIKGIYVPPGVVLSEKRFAETLALIERTELNAIVIDVKDDWGHLTYQSSVFEAQEAGAVRPRMDIEKVLAELKSRDIYTIARLVVFKDNTMATARPEWSVQHVNGGRWTDYKGIGWTDPYNMEVWEYNLAIAEEVAGYGFDEIQFDYVRFPSDGPLSLAVYSVESDWNKDKAIGEFLRYSKQRLEPYGTFLSADVFGLVPTAIDGMGIGQKWEEVIDGPDFVSPMVYPSHYARGTYGLTDPDRAPYETVYASLRDGMARWEEGNAIVRPWLQDFSLQSRYGAEEVRAQIEATYDAGLDQWLLWHPAGIYTEDALLPARN